MGQIANKIALDFFIKMKKMIKEKSKDKKQKKQRDK